MNAPCVAVAYSAGRDSTALLHATLIAARPLGVQVVALHVHHGLSAHAGAWLAHAERQCAQWAADGLPVRFMHRCLKGKPAAGESIEAWARERRYIALAEMAHEAGASLVLLAHHRRDQAETWLLQALRGAGAVGLSSMPARIERGGLTWARPWLDHPRERIEAYVQQYGLAYVDDDSNADTRHARNRLRLSVWPALQAAFPSIEAALADAARHAQQARECLDELAAIDLAAVAEGPRLKVAPWRALSAGRQSNVLRVWIKAQVGEAASARLIERLLRELPKEGEAAWPVRGGSLRRHRGWLSFVTEAPPAASARERSVAIARAGRYRLPGWGGELHARRVKEGGVPLAWLGQLELQPRQGGEQFQAGIGRPARSLKKQYQAADVPAWLRDGPLVYSGGQLVYVPGLGLDARVIGLPGQAQMSLEWHPESTG